MPVSIEELRPHLQGFDFRHLFVEGLGWDNYEVDEPLAVEVNERDHLHPEACIAEKAGFPVYECDSSVDEDIAVPKYPVRRKIEGPGRQV